MTIDDTKRITDLEAEVRELKRATKVLVAASSFFRAGGRLATAVAVQFIDDHKERFGIEPICRVLPEPEVPIAPSTYYAHRTRPASARGRNEQLKGGHGGRAR